MSLELKQIDSNNIEVYSNMKLAGNIIKPDIPVPHARKWFFKPNHDCGCVWTDISLIELGTTIQNMNK